MSASDVFLLLHKADGSSERKRLTLTQEWLDLSHLQLVGVPDDIAQLTRSTALNLRSNALTDIPASVLAMTHLTLLHLTSNRLKWIHPAVGQLTRLTDLALDDNCLVALPREIGQLTGLQALRVDRNALTAVPLELGRLKALRWLFLSHNRLQWLPLSLDRELPQTVRLFVSGNPLPVQVDESGRKHSRDKLAALLTATTHIGTIREEATVVCVGLQELELPALVTLEIIDALFENNIRMAAKWDLVTAVKHFHQRQSAKRGNDSER